jgi:hypothetical protein
MFTSQQGPLTDKTCNEEPVERDSTCLDVTKVNVAKLQSVGNPIHPVGIQLFLTVIGLQVWFASLRRWVC